MASRKGTGFINLQTYLGLNGGGAQALGDSIASRVSGTDQSAVNAIGGTAIGARRMADQAVKAGGAYAGPSSFGDVADMGDIATKMANAQKTASAAMDQTGRAALLAEQFGPSTWGGSMLDSALAGAGGGAQGIANAANGVGKLSKYLTDTTKQTNAYLDSAQSKSANNIQAAQQAANTRTMPDRQISPAVKVGRKRDDIEKYGGRL
jgi:hypothetical protein